MSVTAWRIVKQKKPPRKAFDGEGARLYGGRWNSPGTALVYTAGSQSLAALEILVHVDNADILENYVFYEITMEKAWIRQLAEADLPRNWRSYPAPSKLRRIGDAWAASGVSVALCVPSAVIPVEYNFLLNPRHKDFAQVKIGKAVPFQFDGRLAARL